MVQLHADLEVKARVLYSQTAMENQAVDTSSSSGNIVSLEAKKRATLDMIMLSEDNEEG